MDRNTTVVEYTHSENKAGSAPRTTDVGRRDSFTLEDVQCGLHDKAQLLAKLLCIAEGDALRQLEGRYAARINAAQEAQKHLIEIDAQIAEVQHELAYLTQARQDAQAQLGAAMAALQVLR